jgi:hypothetical protein
MAAEAGALSGAAPDAPRPGVVHSLDRLRIERALSQRTRYRYVQPKVVREGLGWKVTSPNCSRSVDHHGGEIDVAWLEPVNTDEDLLEGVMGWILHGRDHAKGCWRAHSAGPLQELLDTLCLDRQREFWQ